MPYLIRKQHISGCAAFFVVGFLLAVAGCTNPATDDAEQETALLSDTDANLLLQADETLHRRLQDILNADSTYNQFLTTTSSPAALDERNGQVIQAEISLRQTIDSLDQEANRSDNEPLLHLTAYFKKALQSRQALSDLRMMLSADSDDSTAAQQTVAQLRTELQEKNKRITALEQANKTTALQPPKTAPVTEASNDPAAYAPAKGETPADLKQRNKNLATALSSLQTKYFVLGRDYLVLKQQHERTVAELAALRKEGNQK